ncbi:MAG: pilin [Candidatus Amesbacteria bacterium]|nr:pilin [Candidatus Amesbacteria bacterium]
MRKIINIFALLFFLLFLSAISVNAVCDPPGICVQQDLPGYFRCDSSKPWWCKPVMDAPAGCTDQIELKNDGASSTFKKINLPWMDVSEACFLKAGVELKSGHPKDLSITTTNRTTCDSFASRNTLTNYNWVICSACIKAGYDFGFSDVGAPNTSCVAKGLNQEKRQTTLAVREFLEMQGYSDAMKKGQLFRTGDPPTIPAATTGTYKQPDADPQNKNACSYLMSIPDPDSFEKCDDCMKEGHVWTSLGCIKAADPYAFVGQIITWAVVLGAGLATAIIGFQGLQIVMSGDDPKKVKASQEAITAAISGLLLIVFSIMLMNILGIKVLNITNLGFWKP